VFAVGRACSTAVVTLHGELDHTKVDVLSGIVRKLIDDQRNQTVVLDLRDVSGVDPSAIPLFHDAVARAHRRGGAFYLHRPPPAAADTLKADRSLQEIIV
jgi:anti-anti-sigma factor